MEKPLKTMPLPEVRPEVADLRAHLYISQQNHEENICLEMMNNLCKGVDYDILICKTKLIDQISAQKLYQYALQFVETSVTFKEFLSVLKSYDHVAVGITKTEKSIMGMIVNGAEIHAIDGKKFNLLKTGLAFVDSKYRGSIFYVATAAYFALREILLHPTIPLYNLAKCFTYKSYLLTIKYYITTYPRPDIETPEFVKRIIAKFAEQFAVHNSRFVNKSGVLQREHTKISRGVADVSDKELADPNIKFFCEQNPGWHKGHGLIIAILVTWKDVENLIQTAATRCRQHSNTCEPIPKSNL